MHIGSHSGGIHTIILQPFFWDHPGELVPEENLLLDFYCAREDNRGRHTDHLAGRHSVWTNQWPTSIIPPLCQMPFLPQPPTLSWLGTITKYAGLHTQCCGHSGRNKLTISTISIIYYVSHAKFDALWSIFILFPRSHYNPPITVLYLFWFLVINLLSVLWCFDTVGWVSGRASGL